ncbi:MAG: hydrolase [Phycisphaerales bacterium]
MTNTLEPVMSRLASRQGAMVETLASWVAIPTGRNHTPGLDRFRGEITGRLEALGATTSLVAGDPKEAWLGDTKDATIPPTAVCDRLVDGAVRTFIAGHLDTVFPPDSPFDSLTVSPDGATATGPGVVDMKGGLLIAVEALEALHAEGIETGWTFLLNSDEETGSYHSHRALRETAGRHDVGLALEPALPGGGLAVRRKGSGQFYIEAHGRSAHAGREFEKGVSAVYALARAITEIETLSDVKRGLTVNIGPVEGGVATNIVPPLARAWGNVRFPEEALAEAFGARLSALNTAGDAMPRIVTKHNFSRPAKPLTPGTERLASVVKSCAESLGQTMDLVSTGGVCDGNIMQAAGLPTIDTLGVRGGGLHTTDEWIELPSLSERAQLFASLLVALDQNWNTPT